MGTLNLGCKRPPVKENSGIDAGFYGVVLESAGLEKTGYCNYSLQGDVAVLLFGINVLFVL